MFTLCDLIFLLKLFKNPEIIIQVLFPCIWIIFCFVFQKQYLNKFEYAATILSVLLKVNALFVLLP